MSLRLHCVWIFFGKKSYFHDLNEYVRSVWPSVKDAIATTNGFYFLKFKTKAAMKEVIEGGLWLFQGQPIVLQQWEPSMVLRKHKHTRVPIWIKLRHLPVELWTTDGLSEVASKIGRPLYPDAIMMACTRLNFPHVCVMLDISLKLPKHLVIMVACPINKPVMKPRVSTYVLRSITEERKDPPPNVTRGDSSKPHDMEDDQHTAKIDLVKLLTDEGGKDKELVIYNPFRCSNDY
ncbi:UNVERIFIED_CONTAM: hypothetical protein Slati_1357000 [Sesamum latifolium]|uniref:DUF4283 domain-containing protein n=1 Tax=Sesamum latifolium TaxID=2727402 RepID=A0AAW2XIQ5_9LAMI